MTLRGSLLITCFLWSTVQVVSSQSSPAIPEYCSKVDSQSFIDKRRIPILSLDGQLEKPQLLQVQVLIRHGARTPTDKHRCWAGYEPHWYCEMSEIVQGENAGDQLYVPSKREQYFDVPASVNVVDLFSNDVSDLTLTFKKRYDSNPTGNVLGGTCQRGQLLSEGFKQHQIIGALLAEAYLEDHGQFRVPFRNAPILFDPNAAAGSVYYRSTDIQRTLMSGASLLSGMLAKAGGRKGAAQDIVVHTADLESEILYPNSGTCPKLLAIREDFIASSEFGLLQKKFEPLVEKIEAATGVENSVDSWPSKIFDCLMTAICTGQSDSLPPGFSPTVKFITDVDEGEAVTNTLLDLTFSAVDEYAASEFLWEKSIYSKASIGRLVLELKAHMLERWISVLEGDDVSTAFGGSQLVAPVLEFSESRKKRAAVPNEADATQTTKPFILYAAHDTTIMPLLASLEGSVYDKKWPPYASEVVFELYSLVRNNTKEAYLRLIYNGVVLTNKLPGCESLRIPDLCSVASFFEHTKWATPDGIFRLCKEVSLVVPERLKQTRFGRAARDFSSSRESSFERRLISSTPARLTLPVIICAVFVSGFVASMVLAKKRRHRSRVEQSFESR